MERAIERRTSTAVGMAVFLASEATFFLSLILVYLYFRAAATPAALAGHDKLNPARAAVFTAFLIASSVTIWLADRSFSAGDRRGLRLWLCLSLLFGLVFLLGQASEYVSLWNDGLRVESDLFGTQFYTLTGLHFLHVSAGAAMLAILAALALRGEPHEPGPKAMQPIGYYWHFVDAVWIVLFVVIYLVGV